MAGRGREEGGARRHARRGVMGPRAPDGAHKVGEVAAAASAQRGMLPPTQVNTPSTATHSSTHIGGAHGTRSDVLSGVRQVSNKIYWWQK
eukprot:1248410-Prymnesium_polylepis.1